MILRYFDKLYRLLFLRIVSVDDDSCDTAGDTKTGVNRGSVFPVACEKSADKKENCCGEYQTAADSSCFFTIFVGLGIGIVFEVIFTDIISVLLCSCKDKKSYRDGDAKHKDTAD